MTPNELTAHFSKIFGFSNWPKQYEVDAETYGNVCQFIFDSVLNSARFFPGTDEEHFRLDVAVGVDNGILFKNVELILKGRGDVRNTQVSK